MAPHSIFNTKRSPAALRRAPEAVNLPSRGIRRRPQAALRTIHLWKRWVAERGDLMPANARRFGRGPISGDQPFLRRPGLAAPDVAAVSARLAQVSAAVRATVRARSPAAQAAAALAPKR